MGKRSCQLSSTHRFQQRECLSSQMEMWWWTWPSIIWNHKNLVICFINGIFKNPQTRYSTCRPLRVIWFIIPSEEYSNSLTTVSSMFKMPKTTVSSIFWAICTLLTAFLLHDSVPVFSRMTAIRYNSHDLWFRTFNSSAFLFCVFRLFCFMIFGKFVLCFSDYETFGL